MPNSYHHYVHNPVYRLLSSSYFSYKPQGFPFRFHQACVHVRIQRLATFVTGDFGVR